MTNQTPPPFPDFGKPLQPTDPAHGSYGAAEANPYQAPSHDAGQESAAPGYEASSSGAPSFGAPSADAPGFGSDPYALSAPSAASDPYAAVNPLDQQPGQGAYPPAVPYAAQHPFAPGGGYGAPTYDPGAVAAGYAPTAHAYGAGGYPMVPSAPYGVDPITGIPYSDKSKLVAGLLGILLGGFGVGRFYMGNIGMGVAQILVTWLTFGIGALWPLIDGIIILAGNPKDANGRPLRP